MRKEATGIFDRPALKLPTDLVIRVVSEVFGVPEEKILHGTRGLLPWCRARQACMVLLCESGLTPVEVGRELGRERSTVRNGLAVWAHEADRGLNAALRECRQKLGLDAPRRARDSCPHAVLSCQDCGATFVQDPPPRASCRAPEPLDSTPAEPAREPKESA